MFHGLKDNVERILRSINIFPLPKVEVDRYYNGLPHIKITFDSTYIQIDYVKTVLIPVFERDLPKDAEYVITIAYKGVWRSTHEVSTKSKVPNTVNLNYPHKCPQCGGPAYIGFTTIDCSRGCK